MNLEVSQSMKITNLIYLCLGLLVLAYPALVLLNLNRGLDLTDTGFYYLSLQNEIDVFSGPTQFGIVWGLLPIPENMFFNRIALFIFLCSSGGFLANALWTFNGDKIGKTERFVTIALGIASISTFYTWWIPDPSYNSMALVLIPVSIGLALSLARSIKLKGQVPNFVALVSGTVMMALALTRPQSALVLSPALLLFILFIAQPTFRQIYITAFMVTLGALVLIIALALFVEPTPLTVERIRIGVVDRNILQIEKTPGMAFVGFLKTASNVFLDKLFWILALGIGLVLKRNVSLIKTEHQSLVKQTSDIFVALIIVVGLGEFLRETFNLKTFSIAHIAQFTFPFLAALILAALTTLIIRAFSKQTAERRHESIFWLLLLGFIAQIILTGNQWFKFSGWFAFYPLMALLLYTSDMKASRFNFSFMSSILVVLSVQFFAFQQSTKKPYGLSEGLQAQSVATDIRHIGNTLKLDVSTHDFLTAFDAGRKQIAEMSEKPVIIDTTGRLPMVTYHLGGKSTRSPWLMMGHPGSQNMFDASMQHLDNNRLEAAWILYAPNWKRTHGLEKLAGNGLNVPSDYRLIAKATLKGMKSEVWLLAPKP